MLRNLLGIEISQLRFALLCSYIGGVFFIVAGLMFALPSVAIESLNDAASVGGIVLFALGLFRLVVTYLYASGIAYFYYTVIALSILTIINIPLTAVGENLGFLLWYIFLTAIIELLLLVNIFSKNARAEHKSNKS
jgi:membrane-anchored glycerophosphoryl diester phosphodiesterase (GDPDase)